MKRNLFWFVAMAALAAYVVISGKTGSCPACVAITQAAGIVPAPAVVVPDVADTTRRLGVGDSLPAGTLTGSDNMPVDVLAEVSQSPTVFVFYRGGWCPFCSRHLSAIEEIIPQLNALGVNLVAVSPDSPGKLTAKPKLAGLPYKLLSDSPMQWTSRLGIAFKVPDSLVEKYLKSYNIDLEGDSGYPHHLLPHPSVFVVDRDGVIQFAYVNEDYKVRLEPAAILKTAEIVAR